MPWLGGSVLPGLPRTGAWVSQIPWDDEAILQVRAEKVGGESGRRGWGVRDGALRLSVDGPGRYRLSFDRFAGFKEVPPVEVDVRPGEFTKVKVKLETDR